MPDLSILIIAFVVCVILALQSTAAGRDRWATVWTIAVLILMIAMAQHGADCTHSGGC